jgi:RNA polymerase sigma factor (sigma-70 family)
MNLVKTVTYGGEHIAVSQEVADFLERDRRRRHAEGRRDRRHLSKSDFETEESAQKNPYRHGLEDEALQNLLLDELRIAMTKLTDDERRLLHLYFWEEKSMETVGTVFGVSKMAISKRLKKLYAKIRDLMGTHKVPFVSFLSGAVYKGRLSVL